ncbi:hypothetical protein DFH08DRAFT_817214 [Mycena albidolilacea]|uniref:Uncharacterized protein n=1 Tax=Mycena albidolilacea TaxID=1033008 RepID=A0AAD6ZJI4_9AGAR|nr:hypothetical protein DFH08DRAFT_817214 [Mycena albidolilacea]
MEQPNTFYSSEDLDHMLEWAGEWEMEVAVAALHHPTGSLPFPRRLVEEEAMRIVLPLAKWGTLHNRSHASPLTPPGMNLLAIFISPNEISIWLSHQGVEHCMLVRVGNIVFVNGNHEIARQTMAVQESKVRKNKGRCAFQFGNCRLYAGWKYCVWWSKVNFVQWSRGHMLWRSSAPSTASELHSEFGECSGTYINDSAREVKMSE